MFDRTFWYRRFVVIKCSLLDRSDIFRVRLLFLLIIFITVTTTNLLFLFLGASFAFLGVFKVQSYFFKRFRDIVSGYDVRCCTSTLPLGRFIRRETSMQSMSVERENYVKFPVSNGTDGAPVTPSQSRNIPWPRRPVPRSQRRRRFDKRHGKPTRDERIKRRDPR